jgi:hypothetical protein
MRRRLLRGLLINVLCMGIYLLDYIEPYDIHDLDFIAGLLFVAFGST